MRTTKFYSGDITYSEGRMYQKNIYSLPYPLRQFLLPNNLDEGNFFEVDLSSAELTLSSWFYKDTVLFQDIQSGKFWEMWLGRYEGFTKADMKKCLYCMSYSASDVTFPPATPASFFEDFTTRYSVWFQGVLRTKNTYEATPWVFNGRYKNWVTGKDIPVPNPAEHHATFKLLNFRVQQSLSSYAQVLYSAVCRKFKSQGMVPYLLNFDSLFVTWKGHTLDNFLDVVGQVQNELIAEGKLPCVIPFKGNSGKTLAESQGWTEE